MEWQVFLTITSLLAFVSAVTVPLLKLNKTMTRLDINVENLNSIVEKNEKKSKENHTRLWEHNELQDKRLDDHEKRLHDLDKKDEVL